MAGIDIEAFRPEITDFCRRWKVDEFSVFGSAIRNDFDADSDVDVLVTLSPQAQWSLYEWVDMREELQKIFARPVDLVSTKGLRNPFRRKSILGSRRVIYAA